MNVLYMHTHDSGRYFDPFGNRTDTPAIRALASTATVFRRAFSAAPTCSPSRAALLTGMNPHSCGMIGLAHRGFSLNDYETHLAGTMKRAGYETALCGIQHVAEKAEDIGYDVILDAYGYGMSQDFGFDTVAYDESNAATAADFIRKRTAGDRPFFLSFGMFNTHRIFPEVPPEIDPDYLAPPPTIKDTPENRADFAGFIASARAVDRCVGTLMNALEESGQRDDTLIVFTTDHGLPLPDMKCTLKDSGIGVALIIDYPGNPSKGAVSDALVSHLDLFPTICEAAGIDRPTWLEGQSLIPVLGGREEKVRDEIFAEVTYHAAYEPLRCIRTERYKLIRRFDPPFSLIPANLDDCPAKTLLLESGFGDIPKKEYELYDLTIDPLEQTNLADQTDYREIRDGLSERLTTWMEASDDPLCRGPVPLPAGAFANKRWCISPNEESFDFG